MDKNYRKLYNLKAFFQKEAKSILPTEFNLQRKPVWGSMDNYISLQITPFRSSRTMIPLNSDWQLFIIIGLFYIIQQEVHNE